MPYLVGQFGCVFIGSWVTKYLLNSLESGWQNFSCLCMQPLKCDFPFWYQEGKFVLKCMCQAFSAPIIRICFTRWEMCPGMLWWMKQNLELFFFFNTPVHVSVSRKKCLKIATVVDSLKYMAQFLKIWNCI